MRPKESLIKAFILASISVAALNAWAGAGSGREGNGGGGIVRNGEYLTFGSAKVKVKPEPLENIPGLKLALDAINGMPLPARWKTKVWGSVNPIDKRIYYRMDEQDFDWKAKEEFKFKYREAVNAQVPFEELVVYAVTNGQETFLTPEFFQIKKAEGQAAILFHEGLWVLDPRLSYKFVIDAEIVFQGYLESSNGTYRYDRRLFAFFDQVFGNPTISLRAASMHDLSEGNLNGLLDKNGLMPLSVLFGSGDLLGTDYNGPYEEVGKNRRIDIISVGFRDLEITKAHIMNQILKYPRVELFKQLYAAHASLDSSLISYTNFLTDEQGAKDFVKNIPRLREGSIDLFEKTDKNLEQPHAFLVFEAYPRPGPRAYIRFKR